LVVSMVTVWFLVVVSCIFYLFDLLDTEVNWVVRRSNGSDLIVVVGMDACQAFDVFEELRSKVQVEFLCFLRLDSFLAKKAGTVLCAALLQSKTTASKAPPPVRFIKYAMGMWVAFVCWFCG